MTTYKTGDKITIELDQDHIDDFTKDYHGIRSLRILEKDIIAHEPAPEPLKVGQAFHDKNGDILIFCFYNQNGLPIFTYEHKALSRHIEISELKRYPRFDIQVQE